MSHSVQSGEKLIWVAISGEGNLRNGSQQQLQINNNISEWLQLRNMLCHTRWQHASPRPSSLQQFTQDGSAIVCIESSFVGCQPEWRFSMAPQSIWHRHVHRFYLHIVMPPVFLVMCNWCAIDVHRKSFGDISIILHPKLSISQQTRLNVKINSIVCDVT